MNLLFLDLVIEVVLIASRPLQAVLTVKLLGGHFEVRFGHSTGRQRLIIEQYPIVGLCRKLPVGQLDDVEALVLIGRLGQADI